MRIAVDVMGGDKAPREIVRGCVLAARRRAEIPGLEQIIMVGREAEVMRELKKARGRLGATLAFVNADEVVGMDEAPAAAVRKKKRNSLTVCMELVKKGEAQAMVSAGNSGAFAAAALFSLGRIKGVHRPVIAAVLPTRVAKPIVVVDAGANMDCDPAWLSQFAIMGSAYAEKVLGAGEKPVVGLVSIGAEECKGNEFTREAFGYLKKCGVNFMGNMEGHDVFGGKVDVAVCDGFVGNVILKTTEGAARAIGHWLKAGIGGSFWGKIGRLFMAGIFKMLRKKMDPEQYGGAFLLGVDGNAVVTHGASTRRAIFHAISVAASASMNELDATIASRIADYNAKMAAKKAAEAASAAGAAESAQQAPAGAEGNAATAS
ncbi:MAG: phosphate acyltransferase PlsX [Kiritimatiellae bacterium]|nr:phosphate acyltransferase PlsX [Kiritimatiellia bacterium]